MQPVVAPDPAGGLLRPMLVCILVLGVVLTLASESRVLNLQPTQAQGGYGQQGPTGIGTNTVPPRSLFVTGTGAFEWELLALIAAVAVVAAGTAMKLRHRNGNGDGDGD